MTLKYQNLKSSSLCLQIFPSNEKIENINDQYWTLRAEEVYVRLLNVFLSIVHAVVVIRVLADG